MGYTVDISIDVLKHGNVSELIKTVEAHAIEHNCAHYYHMYEMEKHLAIQRHYCIITVAFDEEEVMSCAKFIKYLKYWFKGVMHLECIYADSCASGGSGVASSYTSGLGSGCKLIYASPCYLKQVEKDKVLTYTKYKRERSHSENELMLLEAGGKYKA